MAMIGNGRARCYDKNWKNSVLLLSDLDRLSGILCTFSVVCRMWFVVGCWQKIGEK